MNLDELKSQGVNISMFDGYGVAYDYTLRDNLGLEDMQLTCFGFNEDADGYFCVGAFGDWEVPDRYSSHGASYFFWDEILYSY
jgi:hypothetical protein